MIDKKFENLNNKVMAMDEKFSAMESNIDVKISSIEHKMDQLHLNIEAVNSTADNAVVLATKALAKTNQNEQDFELHKRKFC